LELRSYRVNIFCSCEEPICQLKELSSSLAVQFFLMERLLPLFPLLFFIISGFGQSRLFPSEERIYSRQDSLRGSITPERAWWDLLYYALKVDVDIETQTISGSNSVTYKVLKNHHTLQIDLQPPMKIDKVVQEGKVLNVRQEGNVHFIKLIKNQVDGTENQLEITFSGKPRKAIRAPWEGGFSWTEDKNGRPFVATSNQGLGASVWWPCKDHPYDEPDNGQLLSITVPKDLIAVGNGRLMETKKLKNKNTYVWKVVNPINNYGVNINIGNYTNISSTYDGLKGKLDVDFWVLKQNKEKAEKQFQDAYRTLEAFEYWFGPYPFYEDSYKLVEVPYLGMEHQSSVTYGNNFMNGYLGTDLSDTGWGLKWDFIIIHESGHEWFANNITHKDAADIWIHEGFTSYSESLFTEYFYGKKAGAEYTKGLRKRIQNQSPVIGDYDVNNKASRDVYYKGHNLLHTIRQIINDDERWKSILVGMNKDFYHRTVSSSEIEKYISEKSGIDLSKIFDQYLRDIRVPVLEYFIKDNLLHYRWTNVIEGFDMPLKAKIAGENIWLSPAESFSRIQIEDEDVEFDNNFYVYTFQLKD